MPRLRRPALLGLIALLGPLVAPAPAAEPAARFTGPWNVEALRKAPEATWGEASGLVREVYYKGEPLCGRPTRIFGYYARPEAGDGPFPAMVHVHGGGGKAFREWATLWAQRGYAALAMDLSGRGPAGRRLPDGGPDQDDESKFRDFAADEAGRMWTYHAVAAVLRGHSLLAARPEVDARRIGVTGISWGGYLTCIVAGLDDRLKVAVPVYGCGFLHEDSAWVRRFARMSPAQRDRWVSLFDPSRYLPGVSCPILFVNGTNDFAYPLDSYQKSYRLVPGPRTLCVTVRMPHGHPQGWAPREIGLFVDGVLKDGTPLAQPGPVTIDGRRVTAPVSARVPLTGAQLHYTTDAGPWSPRDWHSVDAILGRGRIEAELPETRPLVFFLTVTDERGAVTSTEHEDLRGPKPAGL
jgi:dienelactone hydrolase